MKLLIMKLTVPMPVSGDVYKYLWCTDVVEEGGTVKAIGEHVAIAVNKDDVYALVDGLGAFAPKESSPETGQAVL